jgi:hypothetical protein
MVIGENKAGVSVSLTIVSLCFSCFYSSVD